MARLTLNKLAKEMRGGFSFMKQRFSHLEGLIEKLAISTQKGFEKVDERLDNLEKGQEDMKLSLDQHAYAIDVKDLKHRMTRVEKKVGIS
jgi:hypothetical protein